MGEQFIRGEIAGEIHLNLVHTVIYNESIGVSRLQGPSLRNRTVRYGGSDVIRRGVIRRHHQHWPTLSTFGLYVTLLSSQSGYVSLESYATLAQQLRTPSSYDSSIGMGECCPQTRSQDARHAVSHA